ncbi:SpoIIE family protein phosphatase [Nocardioides sp. HDW12B]|uniref:PP2C family protein-serine/threonine phosphatase n=1 Tax=Nocardioides sp. HDW12B TaxID=2714939 RepID=UPI00140E4A92|nr:SpoIIE family protein phosphatase [Nocardioides sp. HDW12B]QIK66784.1 SpoIIE family protein phosphatase [Nocardioides sp. HDW12B]
MSHHSLVLIEDDAGDRLLVTDMLEGVAPDIHLTCFATLQATLDAWPPDTECVLLDLGLPDAMGLSALERLRAAVPDVPIVVLTGRIDDGIGRVALAAGAQDYLVKGQVDGTAIERSVRYAVERGRAALDRRRFVAAELIAQENARLQRGLLPSPLIGTSELRVASFYRPGGGRALLGGDFFDVVQTSTGVHLLIGDVSGHGPEEAALGVALRIAWRTLVLAGHTGADVVRGVEQVLLAERHDDDRFATIATVSLDSSLARAEVLLCGHPSPLLVRGGAVDEIDGSRLPILTLLDGHAIEPFAVDLDDDWGLLLFTDGLFEGRAAPGATTRLGTDGLVRQLSSLVANDTPRDALASALFAAVEGANGGPLADDVAALLVGTAGWWS